MVAGCHAGEEIRIGGSDASDEYLFGRVGAIAARGAGPLYMYDDQFHQLRMYDATGRYVRQMGRVGRGPGEYQYVIGLSVLQDGRVAAWDARQSRINIFAANGDRIDDLQLVIGRGLFTAKAFATDTANRFYVLTLSRGRLLTLRVDSRGPVADTVAFPPGQPFLGMDRVHARLERQLHHHGFYVWGNSDRYVIHARAPDGQLMQMERRVAPSRFSADERTRYQARLDAEMGRSQRPRAGYEVVPEFRPFFLDVRVATDGSTWVLRSMSDSTPDVFEFHRVRVVRPIDMPECDHQLVELRPATMPSPA